MNIVSLGPSCLNAILLRQLGLREKAYPYDWAFDTTLSEVIDVVKEDDTFDVTTWFRFQNIGHYLPHDVDRDTHGESENVFESMSRLEKYKRRFARFFADSKKSNTHFVRFGPESERAELASLQQLLPNATFHLIDIHLSDADKKVQLRQLFPDTQPLSVYIQHIVDTVEFPATFDTLVDPLCDPYLTAVKSAPHKTIYDRHEFLTFLGQTLMTSGYDISLL